MAPLYPASFKIMVSVFPLSKKVTRGANIDATVLFLQFNCLVSQNVTTFTKNVLQELIH